mmetsp:Transcript_687/g.1730  ORF Transcript_687/g.1730 Transcript_687/m.1730 type:complete len:237 (+) Transcript_687:1862-2572(+)
MGKEGSRYQRPDAAQVGPSSGFSRIMQRLVSRDTRTVASNGIWKAVRMYWVRTNGRSCLESTALNTSVNKSANAALSSSFTVRPFFLAAATMSSSASSTVYSPSMKGTTLSSEMVNRSLTLSSPFQLSLCVLRSTKTKSGGRFPYQRMRSAMAPGFLSRRPWYSSQLELSKYTLLTSCASPAKLFLSNWKTGRCCSTWCFTVDTSSLRTQYLVVERVKPCAASSFFSPVVSPRSLL